MVCMLIIPEAMRETANALALQIDPTSEGETFLKRLRTIGSIETTHRYIGPNLIDQSVIEQLRALAASPAFAEGIYHECPPDNVRAEFLALIAANGLEEVPPQE